MHVPVITQDDLDTYHKKHFTSSRLPIPLEQASLEYDDDPGTYDEDDDGLGYYDDGVKRTLTDEQIAMFRHSEIQALLKERRLREEIGNDDCASATIVTDSTTDTVSPAPTANQSRSVDTKQADTQAASNARIYDEPPKKKSKRAHRSVASKMKKRQANELKRQTATTPTNVATKPDANVSFMRYADDVRTSNRRARELDDAKTGAIELDY